MMILAGDTEVSDVDQPIGRKFLGVACEGFYDVTKYAEFADQTRSAPNVALSAFFDVADQFDGDRVAQFSDAGYITQLTWSPRRATLSEIASGNWDEQIARTARQSIGARVQVRFGHEMNLPSPISAWGQQPVFYVAAWKRARAVWRDAGNEADWVWSANITDPDDWRTALEQYFPGDGECEYVGLDGYSYAKEGNKSFEAIFDRDLKNLSLLSTRPLWITETGASNASPARAGWIVNMSTYLSQRPRIVGLTWWNRNQYAISSDRLSSLAFGHEFGNWSTKV